MNEEFDTGSLNEEPHYESHAPDDGAHATHEVANPSPLASVNEDRYDGIDEPHPADTSTVAVVGQSEAGKGGEGGAPDVSNAEFVAAIFDDLPGGDHAAVCTKSGDPQAGGWPACRADNVSQLSDRNNNYVSCSTFRIGPDGNLTARKEWIAAYRFILLDDLGGKIPLERLGDFRVSWRVETSPGNYQAGIILREPITNVAEAEALQGAILRAGLCDPGATGLTRWARLPIGINGKPKYADASGQAFQCALREWRPNLRYTVDEIVRGLNLQIEPVRQPAGVVETAATDRVGGVLIPRAEENPVVTALKKRGLYKAALGSGKHDVTCPWVREHTDELDHGSAYFEPDDQHPHGGFCCQHSHRDKYHLGELLRYLEVSESEALNRPVIQVAEGDLDAIVDAAEHELAQLGSHFQYGGLIASVTVDPITGDPSVVATSQQALTRVLSRALEWQKHSDKKGWVSCDPPQRHISILYDAQSFRHLKPLSGIARQPYFREVDGSLVTDAGYDSVSQRFAVFESSQFCLPEPTREAAQCALALLEELLDEFHFVAPTDRAAALSAMFTAVVRPSLPYAPAFHVRAPVMGSGKTYLCELIGAFAGPGGNAKVSYPPTADEATKVILSLLLSAPAVIEFDDMGTDWIPHGIINRMLTAEHITDRILGVSKTATVSTRTLLLGSGNNVGPVRDLLRRVLTIHIDPRCATPATMAYTRRPVHEVRSKRGVYVGGVLTIIRAWLKAGSPRAEFGSIATFGGAWADYCRQPLIWLGQPDPATGLLEQIRHDPDADALLGLMTAWRTAFGSRPTTVRKAVEAAEHDPDLHDAMGEFPVEERGGINRSKLGWLLKKNANRIVGGLEFQRADADGRTGWRVVGAGSPPSPPSPPSVDPTGPRRARNTDLDDFDI